MSNKKAKVHINNVSKMIDSKRIKLSEGMAIHMFRICISIYFNTVFI